MPYVFDSHTSIDCPGRPQRLGSAILNFRSTYREWGHSNGKESFLTRWEEGDYSNGKEGIRIFKVGGSRRKEENHGRKVQIITSTMKHVPRVVRFVSLICGC